MGALQIYIDDDDDDDDDESERISAITAASQVTHSVSASEITYIVSGGC